MIPTTANYLCRWTSKTNRQAEVQILSKGDYVIAKLFNTFRGEEFSTACYLKEKVDLHQLKECVHFSKKHTIEWRIFRCAKPDSLVGVILNSNRLEIRAIQWRNLTEEHMGSMLECIFNYDVATGEVICDSSKKFDKNNPDGWIFETERADEGITYIKANGDEDELVRLDSK